MSESVGTSKLRLRIFDGTRQPFAAPANFLITIIDGNQKQYHREYHKENDLSFELPFFNNFGDRYTIVVWAKGYRQCGLGPITTLSNQHLTVLDVMLIRKSATFNFVDARWPSVKTAYPFLAYGAERVAAEKRYEELLETAEPAACLLNLCEAMSKIFLPQGTPLDYLKELRWDAPYGPAKDRFFAWCDPLLIDQIKASAASGKFAVENAPGIFHEGATSSWKQIQFGEANVQLTFHENNERTINKKKYIMVEPDIDYYRSLEDHVIFEVIPNGLTHSLTKPSEVYVLRWMAGRQAGVPEFAPKYTLT